MAVVDHLPGPLDPATDDDQVDGVPAAVVARPASTEQTAALMQECHARGLAVVVRGHGTKLSWGRPPERLDVIVDTRGMDRLVEHARGDLIATAGAGMPLDRLQALLAEGGHQVALDDVLTTGAEPGGPGSTLGGAMATNLSGPRRMWAGTLRDLVIGVRFVRADGTPAKAGGKVVKNVAGYDLSKLLTGSFGSLAIVTEITVRLHPLPAASHWVGIRLPWDRLGAVLTEVVASQLVPHAVEVHVGPAAEPTVVALLEGTVAGARARAESLAHRLGDSAWIAEQPPTWWGTLPVDPTPPAQGAAGCALIKATATLSGIPALLATLADHGATVTGSAGTGVLHATVPAEPSSIGPALSAIRASSTRLGGSAVLLDAPGPVKAELDTWGPVPALDLMRRVKHEFDPDRLLAPGRFVGGI